MSSSTATLEHLIQMANDIGHFFAGSSGDRAAAVTAIANHITMFWAPQMRRKLLSGVNTIDTETKLEELPREALRLLPDYAEGRAGLARAASCAACASESTPSNAKNALPARASGVMEYV